MRFNPNPKVRHIYVEEVEWLMETGERDPERISERLGVKPGSLARAMRREGRHDLARPFERGLKRGEHTRICRPCRTGDHQEHRIYLRDHHKCQCSSCRSTDNARKREGL